MNRNDIGSIRERVAKEGDAIDDWEEANTLFRTAKRPRFPDDARLCHIYDLAQVVRSEHSKCPFANRLASQVEFLCDAMGLFASDENP